ncbi:hypothetical protein J3A83DRAFT_603177 [Scleroderma citrinum]
MTHKFTINQGLYNEPFSPIFVTTVDERLLEKDHIQSFLNTVDSDGAIGMAAIYGKRCAITAVAFSSLSSSLVIQFTKQYGRHALTFLKDCILDKSCYTKYAFKMDTFCLALFTDLSLRISNAVDLLSLNVTDDRYSLDRLLSVMGGESKLHKSNVKSLFFKDTKKMSPSDVALQAWAACRTSALSDTKSIPRIDTSEWALEARYD